MTPAREAALQWFAEKGRITGILSQENPPPKSELLGMYKDGQIRKISTPKIGAPGWVLTEKGCRDLHEVKP